MADRTPLALPDPAAVDRLLRRAATLPAPWLHGEVARRMAARLPMIRFAPKAVVDWWGHWGGSADALASALPGARRIVVEPTRALLERSRADAQRPWWSPSRRRAPDVVLEADVPAASAQLLWANLMLHAAIDPPALFVRWRRAIAVNGYLMFTGYGPDTLAELRSLYRTRGWAAPALAFADMHDTGDALVRAGFADPVMDQEHLSLTWANADALLGELRALGVNTSRERMRGLRTPRWRDALRDALQSLRRPDGRLALTFEIVYGHAFVPPPRPAVAQTTAVSLDAMRTMVRAGRGGPKRDDDPVG
jgi:malonyl-CoA O-methyltransferase